MPLFMRPIGSGGKTPRRSCTSRRSRTSSDLPPPFFLGHRLSVYFWIVLYCSRHLPCVLYHTPHIDRLLAFIQSWCWENLIAPFTDGLGPSTTVQVRPSRPFRRLGGYLQPFSSNSFATGSLQESPNLSSRLSMAAILTISTGDGGPILSLVGWIFESAAGSHDVSDGPLSL